MAALQQEGRAPQPLFGGALAASLPAGALDASDVREVPDNQEVFTLPQGASVLVEIVEPADVPDDAAAAFYWRDLAEVNDAEESDWADVELADAAKPVQWRAGAMPLAGACMAGSGVQRIPMKEAGSQALAWHTVRVHMAALRLPAHKSDIVLSMNVPVGAPGAGGESGPEAEAHWQAAFLAVLGSLVVRDFTLFGEE